ncbi:MAG: hypothetical protein JWM10_4153 [Myxococcaceae bacterium]|nr:hypothetical protein [Myxococcaceae bacterium]
MAATPPRLSPARILLLALASPVLVVYGFVVLGRWVAGLARGIRGARLALASSLPCPHGHPNPTVGRWTCASCHASYHGWVGRCEICGAGAGWISCEVCGVGVVLPWVRP